MLDFSSKDLTCLTEPAQEEHHIICVDDDVNFLKSFECLISSSLSTDDNENVHYRVICFDDPHQALAVLGELVDEGQSVALVVTDYRMPKMNGTEFLTEVGNLAPQSRKIMLTGYAGLESAVHAINAKLLDKYLTKPIVDEQDFTLTIQQTLKLYRANMKLKHSEDQLRQMAYRDSLTRLPNRMAFKDQLDQAIGAAREHDRMMAVLFLDLDNIKRVNDTMGHSVGDLLLQAAAQRLASCVRSSDYVTYGRKQRPDDQVARLGGDEFTVLLSAITGEQDAVIVSERILDELSKPFMLGNHEVIVTPSIGVSVFPHDGKDVDSLLRHADMAMYHAKRTGKNDYRFYDQSMGEATIKRMTMEGKLHKALDRGELSLSYQPQIDAPTRRITGVEALLRWRNDELGAVSPAEFIPVMEETGLIIAVGEWVLRTACAQAKAWQDAGVSMPRISVNLSARQFTQPNLVSLIAGILKETGLEANCLELEITESMVMADGDESINTLQALKAMDVQLAIDDFGTGYSNLSYLKRLPIDRLKIDQSFVRNLCTDQSDAAIITAIIALADSLKMNVIAEGVETEGQMDFLSAKLCTEMQGFLFSKPVPSQEIPALIQYWELRTAAAITHKPYKMLSRDDEEYCNY